MLLFSSTKRKKMNQPAVTSSKFHPQPQISPAAHINAPSSPREILLQKPESSPLNNVLQIPCKEKEAGKDISTDISARWSGPARGRAATPTADGPDRDTGRTASAQTPVPRLLPSSEPHAAPRSSCIQMLTPSSRQPTKRFLCCGQSNPSHPTFPASRPRPGPAAQLVVPSCDQPPCAAGRLCGHTCQRVMTPRTTSSKGFISLN